tara:strand:- start:1183 stop:1425 length:243 start_codon:yes stop_codon:yes gene_type:complete
MKQCVEICIKNNYKCPLKKCKHWIKYKEDLNCTLIAVEKNGPMTLREVAERLGVSFVRIKQIQDRALKKIQLREIEIFDD